MNHTCKTLLFIIITTSIPLTSWAIVDFPPRSKGPVQPVTEAEAIAEAALPKQSITPQTAKTNRIKNTQLVEIKITVLHGHNKDGEKSHKINYRVIETDSQTQERKEPAVKVVYKQSQDKLSATLSEVKIKSQKDGRYKITASFVENRKDEEIAPKITYLD